MKAADIVKHLEDNPASRIIEFHGIRKITYTVDDTRISDNAVRVLKERGLIEHCGSRFSGFTKHYYKLV